MMVMFCERVVSWVCWVYRVCYVSRVKYIMESVPYKRINLYILFLLIMAAPTSKYCCENKNHN